MTPTDISSEALSWLRTPYHWQGRSRAGLDCLGLPIVVGEALGLIGTVDVPRYRPPLSGGLMTSGFRQYLVERAHARKSGCAGAATTCCTDCLQQLAGTVVVLGRNELHCGIPTDDGRIVTVVQDGGCHAVSYTPALLRLTRHVFDYPGVDYGR